MIEIVGSKSCFCDGVSRREFVRIGTISLGALSLPELLQRRAKASTSKKTSVIFLELAGGPTQFETYDPKPNAPSEYRGPFGTVNTNVTGVQFSELMVEQAKVMDKLAIIRSIHHESSSHDPSSHLTQTGYYKTGKKGGPNQMPCIGSVAAKIRGANAPCMPAYVAVPNVMRNGRAAFLGNSYAPFEVGSDPNREDFRVKNLSLSRKLTIDRLEDRRTLLTTIDNYRRDVDRVGDMEAVDKFTHEAVELLTGEKARRAFDISAESGAVRDRYGRSNVGQGMLLARRLIEAGVTFVTVRVTGWDDHDKIEQAMRKKGPAYDQGVAALVSELHERGLDRDVLVVAMGEFGRTPRVNKNAGRDHWGSVMSVLMAGGGLKVGQVVGSSTSKGEKPADSPYRPENILAMVYRHLGIDPRLAIPDLASRFASFPKSTPSYRVLGRTGWETVLEPVATPIPYPTGSWSAVTT